MKNETYYFPHDYYARKDPKCIALIKDFGISGYGTFWSLIEVMYEQGGKIKKFPSLFAALSHEFNVSEKVLTKQIEAMLQKYELLLQDDTHIWSNTVLSRLQIREAKKMLRSESGKLGGIKSGLSRRKKVQTKQNEALLEANEANEPKESKVKESKVKKILYRKNIALTENEHSRLINEYSQLFIERVYDFFSAYKLEKKYKTQDDNLTIRRWVIDAVSKKDNVHPKENVDSDETKAKEILNIH